MASTIVSEWRSHSATRSIGSGNCGGCPSTERPRPPACRPHTCRSWSGMKWSPPRLGGFIAWPRCSGSGMRTSFSSPGIRCQRTTWAPKSHGARGRSHRHLLLLPCAGCSSPRMTLATPNLKSWCATLRSSGTSGRPSRRRPNGLGSRSRLSLQCVRQWPRRRLDRRREDLAQRLLFDLNPLLDPLLDGGQLVPADLLVTIVGRLPQLNRST